MELGLQSRNTARDFLEQSRESKGLGHQREDQPGKVCFEGQHLDSILIWILQRKASREHHTYQSSISRARIHLEGVQCGNRPEGSA